MSVQVQSDSKPGNYHGAAGQLHREGLGGVELNAAPSGHALEEVSHRCKYRTKQDGAWGPGETSISFNSQRTPAVIGVHFRRGQRSIQVLALLCPSLSATWQDGCHVSCRAKRTRQPELARRALATVSLG